jgi:hypothetical protein
LIHKAKAASAGSIQATGSSRGPLRLALAPRDARSGSTGSGAPTAGRIGRTLATLVLAIAAFALMAVPASAVPPTPKMGPITDVSYSSFKVSGSIAPSNGLTIWQFQTSTDGTNWVDVGGSAFFGNEEKAVGPLDITGLKGGTKYFVRLRATNNIEEGITPAPYDDLTTLPVDPPVIVATNDASPVFSTSATATGTVKRPVNADPSFDVTCRFEYVTHADFLANAFKDATVRDCVPSPIGPADANTNKAVTAALGCANPVVEEPEGKCLKPATNYHLRMVTENASPTVVIKEATNTFTTSATVAKPTVIATNDATDVTYREAKVSGEIERPAGADPALNSSCRFEYVKDVDFKATLYANAKQTPCVEAPAETPHTGTGPKAVSAELTFLHHDTVYHYRLAAANGGGVVSKEASKTFTTLTGTPPILTVNPIPPGDVGYTKAHVTGSFDPGTPVRSTSFGWTYSTDPNAPDNEWKGIGICCGGPGAPEEVSSDLGSSSPYGEGGLLPGTKYYVRMVAFDYTYADEGEAFSFYSPAPYQSFTTKGTNTQATVALDPITTFTATTAHFSGTVDTKAPAGPLIDEAKVAYDTTWYIECEPECKNKNGNLIGGTIQAEEGSEIVSGDAIRLAPNTLYDVKLVATNVLGTVETPLKPLTTTLIKPTVKSAEGASDGKGGYTIQGVVNPNNADVTTCKFEWGPTAPDYAFSAPCSPSPAGRNEIQEVWLYAVGNGSGFAIVTEGEFVLTFRGQTTTDLPYDASPNEVETALKALSTIGPNDVKVSSGPGAGRGQGYRLVFEGALKEKDLPQVKGGDGTFHLGSDSGEGGGPDLGWVGWSTFQQGGNSKPVVVEAHLPGLTPGAVYHFNLIAKNAAGQEVSGDREFVPKLAPVEECPNEQIRKENNSLAQGECRAYELITPMGKEGFAANYRGVAKTNSNTVAFQSKAGNLAKSGTNAALQGSIYVSRRKSSGWETISNLNGGSGTLRDAPSLVTTPTSGGAAYSPDLLTSVWKIHRQDGTPGDNYYLRNEDGTFTLIGPNDGNSGLGVFEGSAISGDLEHVVRWNGGPFWPSLWGSGVYETVGTGWTGAPKRVDVDNTGSPISTCGESTGRAVSSDGRVILFSVAGGCGGANPPAEELRARVGGTTSIDVSGTQCTRVAPACNAPAVPQFVAMTPDGSRVFFTTTQQLVNADTDEGNDLYACDIPAGVPAPVGTTNHCATLRKVSAPLSGAAEVEDVRGSSADGSMTYFIAKGILANNKNALGAEAVDGDHNLYVWRIDAAHPNGQATFLARLESIDFSAQSTPNGRYMVFTTYSQLLETDTDNARDIYRFDAETGELRRVSTNINGVAGNADGIDSGIAFSEAMSDDGSKIAFESSEALSPVDGNAEPDVYLWTPDRVFLITTGSVGGGSGGEFSSAAVDGSGQNVFFQTAAPLSPADGDDLRDVYTARVGGGFSFASKPRCVGEICQPPVSEVPAVPVPTTSQTPADPGNVVAKKCPKGKVLKGEKCVKKKKNKKKNKKKKKKKAGNKRGGSK